MVTTQKVKQCDSHYVRKKPSLIINISRVSISKHTKLGIIITIRFLNNPIVCSKTKSKKQYDILATNSLSSILELPPNISSICCHIAKALCITSPQFFCSPYTCPKENLIILKTT